MSSVNKVILVGNLGDAPSFRETTSGKSVASFNVATNERYKDSSGEPVDRTEWHRVVIWGKLAEICTHCLDKGSKIYVEGKLQTNSWEDKETGQKRYSTNIVAQSVQFLSQKKKENEVPMVYFDEPKAAVNEEPPF